MEKTLFGPKLNPFNMANKVGGVSAVKRAHEPSFEWFAKHYYTLHYTTVSN